MNELYVARFRKVFACSDVNRAVALVLAVAQMHRLFEKKKRRTLIRDLINDPKHSFRE